MDENWMTDEEFRRFLQASGFRIVEIPSDGNCLYGSVALAIYGDANLHGVVRNELHNHISENRQLYQPWTCNQQDFERELEAVRVNGTWGNTFSIVGASRLYNRNITVFLPTGSSVNFGQGHQTDLYLSYHNSSHYNLLIRQENQNDDNSQDQEAACGPQTTSGISDEPPNQNECPTCLKRFRLRNGLRFHIKMKVCGQHAGHKRH